MDFGCFSASSIGKWARRIIVFLFIGMVAMPVSAATFDFSYLVAGDQLTFSGNGSFSTISDADGTYTTDAGITDISFSNTSLTGFSGALDFLDELLAGSLQTALYSGLFSADLVGGNLANVQFGTGAMGTMSVRGFPVTYDLSFAINGLGQNNATASARVRSDGGLGSLINFSDNAVGHAEFVNVTPPLQQDNGFFIRDLQTSSSVFTVADHGGVSDLSLSMFGLEHSFAGDLTFSLSHLGTTVIFANPWGDRTTPTGTSTDLNGNYVIEDGIAPTLFDALTGDVLAEGTYGTTGSPFAAFDGMDRAGDWILSIADNTLKDQGILNRWSLAFGPAGPIAAVPESGSWAVMLGGFVMMGSAARRRQRLRPSSAA